MNTCKHTVTVPSGQITVEGQRAIQDALYRLPLVQNALPDDWQWSAMATGRGEYVGSFAKRIAKYYHRRGVKLDSDFLGKIGSLVAQHTNRQTEYTIDYTSDFDWKAGDFGDAGSCYWGCRTAAREALSNAHALAVRFWDGNTGFGRAWMVPLDNGWVIFNGYGHETSTIARIVAADLGASYKRIRAENNGESTGQVWINNDGRAYLVGNVDNVEFDQKIDLQIEDASEAKCCYRCESETYYLTEAEGEEYCQDCLDRCFTLCNNCEEYVSDATKVTGMSVCNSCLENYSQCHNCDEYDTPDSFTEVNDYQYCEHCLDEIFTLCDICSEYHKETTLADGKDVCEDCLTTCKECGENHLEEVLTS